MGRWTRRIVTGLGALVALAVVCVGGLWAVGSTRVAKTYEVETAGITLPTDPAEIARGGHLARTNGCMDCHGDRFQGRVVADDPPFRIAASNLTSGAGGIGARYTAEDFDRAIRHGVRPDGTSLLIMPSAAYHNMSDVDAAALIAYLQTVPPVDHELPERTIRPLGRILANFAIDPALEVRVERPGLRAAPPRGATVEYGQYLANLTCTYCHGADLRGVEKGPNPAAPPAPDLEAAATGWTPAQWETALTTGRTPDGRSLDPMFMPWTLTAAMGSDEREALRMYVASRSR